VADQVTRGAARLALAIALPIALIAGLVAFWRLGGFGTGHASPSSSPSAAATGVVDVPVPTLDPTDATMCLAFIALLPPKLRDLPQRPVSAGGNQQNAAYGDPPVTVACGGAKAAYPSDALLWVLSGVCWYADQAAPAATVWTTVDRQVPIRVRLPASYTGQGEWVQEFSSPIVAAVPSLPQAALPASCSAPSTPTASPS